MRLKQHRIPEEHVLSFCVGLTALQTQACMREALRVRGIAIVSPSFLDPFEEAKLLCKAGKNLKTQETGSSLQ